MKSFYFSIIVILLFPAFSAALPAYANDPNLTNLQKIILASPLEQFKAGILVDNIVCEPNLQLIIKAEDGSPACVQHDTVNILIERGWAMRSLPQLSENTTLSTSTTSCDTPFGSGMLYMPKNSVGKICVTTSISDPALPPLGFSGASGYPNPKIVISKYPTIIHQGTNTIMVYTITTGNYSGISDFTFICSELPFAVGNYNVSVATLRSIPSFGGMFVGAHSCPPSTYEYSLSGVSSIGFKIIH